MSFEQEAQEEKLNKERVQREKISKEKHANTGREEKEMTTDSEKEKNTYCNRTKRRERKKQQQV